MGNSLHNKIYLGRRHVLVNVARVKKAACIATVAAGVMLAMFWKVHLG